MKSNVDLKAVETLTNYFSNEIGSLLVENKIEFTEANA